MARVKLQRALKKCEREGCENTFIVKVGAAYDQHYCSPRCAALSNKGKRKRRARNLIPKYSTKATVVRDAFTLNDLQNIPVDFTSRGGGKFVEICNGILSGQYSFVGPSVL